ncbi:MAG: SDR family NAD(P)-dependent oxidoreductase [Propionibacteriaceae bacterium]|jgi:NAD(P)-dependent dehydrogenase (short-subunit alcohol dehydrogenase family)|nr:SDR family NAD(P)-dependent oxidoreductase [Propionibacteriaceae bacterium]
MSTTTRATEYAARFSGLTAVVTGAGSGIGLATARMLIEDGGRVIAVDISQPRLDEAAALIGPSYIPVAADITAEAGPQLIAEAAGGPIDILINNAGIMDGFLPITELDDATWHKVLNVNLTGQMRLVRQFLPAMLEAGHGAIVNISSEAALRICAGVAYTVSKHGVIGLTKHVAAMYGPQGIRSNAIAPGGVKTNVGGEFLSQLAAARLGPIMAATSPGMAEPEWLARAICFLADDHAASHINGIVLAVDGGWSVM